MGKTCFFLGHRDAPESVRGALEKAVERCIAEKGIGCFVVGQYGSFDRLAAQAVLAAKKEFPQVTLFLLLPYSPAVRPVKTPPGFDGTYYPEGMESVPQRFAIVRANRYMVDHSDCLIAYAWHPGSNAQALLRCALRRAKKGALSVIALPCEGVL